MYIPAKPAPTTTTSKACSRLLSANDGAADIKTLPYANFRLVGRSILPDALKRKCENKWEKCGGIFYAAESFHPRTT
jgi:hypothetical protein